MIGDTFVLDSVEYEVIWNGGEGLIGDRPTLNTGVWEPPLRMYNKTGKHTKEAKEAKKRGRKR